MTGRTSISATLILKCKTRLVRLVIAASVVAMIATTTAFASTQWYALNCCGLYTRTPTLHTQSITTLASGSGTWKTGFWESSGWYWINCTNNCSVNVSNWPVLGGSAYAACGSDLGSGSYWVSCRYP